jgi:Fe-S-cluster containining protein
MVEQYCKQCGKCCEKWGWDQKGIIEDVIPWFINDRKDILRHVSFQFNDGTRVNGTNISSSDFGRIISIDYWIEPNGKYLHNCPFFRRAENGKVYCRIHDMKPAVCQGFAPWAEIWHDYGLNCPACKDISP